MYQIIHERKTYSNPIVFMFELIIIIGYINAAFALSSILARHINLFN